jgi:L-lactate dehydrogenase complex protein LldG
MSAREEVLRRIRRALAQPPDGSGPAAGETQAAGEMPAATADAVVPRGYRTSSELAGAELLDMLTDRLTDYGSAVRRCRPGELEATVAAALADRGVHRIVVPPGLPLAQLATPDPRLGQAEVVIDAGRLSASELDGFDGVVTTATVAIAETGTIVLDGSAGQGRRALSLIPDYHLCILADSQVVGLVTQSIPMLTPRQPLTWISGPSATSDIELDRVQGVHGPRTLEVILVIS